MPNYDYECQACGHRFEVFQGMNDPKLQDCPLEACDGAVKRLKRGRGRSSIPLRQVDRLVLPEA